MKKLLEFQKRINAIPKDSTNPFFKSKYFDVNTVIEVIRPILNELELVVTQPLTNINGVPAIRTQIWDGDKVLVDDAVPLPVLADAQKMGAAITYFRRYALVSTLLLQGEEDDDGNALTKQPTTIKQGFKI